MCTGPFPGPPLVVVRRKWSCLARLPHCCQHTLSTHSAQKLPAVLSGVDKQNPHFFEMKVNVGMSVMVLPSAICCLRQDLTR